MQSNFSEFSYGFALTRELCERLSWGRLQAAPVFPSLIEEGQQGYDVRLDWPGRPVFLQFKLSEYMVSGRAGQRHLFGRPYYRFWLRPYRVSRQHELLLARDRAPNIVLYAAPSVHQVEELNHAFLRRAVVDASVFVRPRDIGPLPDHNDHCVAFIPNGQMGYLCSDPRPIEIYSIGPEVIDTMSTELERITPVVDTGAYFEELASDLRDLLLESGPMRVTVTAQQLPELIPNPARRAAYLCRTILGAELLWVTEATA